MTRNRSLQFAAALAGSLVAAAAISVPAEAKTWKAAVADPVGDAPAPGRDIAEVKFRYKTNGSILFVVTTAGPIDPVNADAAVGVSFGSSCRTAVAAGGGLFSEPGAAPFFTVKRGKAGKPRKGKGEVIGNVYKLSIKHSAFRNKKAGCFAVALIDPVTADTESPVVFDTTDEVKLKRS